MAIRNIYIEVQQSSEYKTSQSVVYKLELDIKDHRPEDIVNNVTRVEIKSVKIIQTKYTSYVNRDNTLEYWNKDVNKSGTNAKAARFTIKEVKFTFNTTPRTTSSVNYTTAQSISLTPGGAGYDLNVNNRNLTFKHDNEGNKTLAIKVDTYDGRNWFYNRRIVFPETNIKLERINKASTFTLENNGNIENGVHYNITANSDKFSHEIYYKAVNNGESQYDLDADKGLGKTYKNDYWYFNPEAIDKFCEYWYNNPTVEKRIYGFLLTYLDGKYIPNTAVTSALSGFPVYKATELKISNNNLFFRIKKVSSLNEFTYQIGINQGSDYYYLPVSERQRDNKFFYFSIQDNILTVLEHMPKDTTTVDLSIKVVSYYRSTDYVMGNSVEYISYKLNPEDFPQMYPGIESNQIRDINTTVQNLLGNPELLTFVRNKSYIEIESTGLSAGTNADLKNLLYKFGSKQIQIANNSENRIYQIYPDSDGHSKTDTIGLLDQEGTLPFIVTVENSRGLSKSYELGRYEILNYSNPTCTITTLTRSGTQLTNLTVKGVGYFYPLDVNGVRKNSLTVAKAILRETNTTTDIPIDLTVNYDTAVHGQYVITNTSGNFDIEKSYNVSFTITDSLSGVVAVTASSLILPKAVPVFAITPTGVEVNGQPINGGTVDPLTILNMVYPVGSIYMSVVNTSPSSFLGGTWERVSAGRVITGVYESDSEFSTPEKMNGYDKTHSHNWKLGRSVDPNFHQHEYGPNNFSLINNGAYSYVNNKYKGYNIDSKVTAFIVDGTPARDTSRNITSMGTSTIGDTSYSTNLSPYYTCYIWKRTA